MVYNDAYLKLRFSEALRMQLERAAKKAGHSMNMEIIHRLEISLQNERIAAEVKREWPLRNRG